MILLQCRLEGNNNKDLGTVVPVIAFASSEQWNNITIVKFIGSPHILKSEFGKMTLYLTYDQ
jgi:hypothetical protein